MTAGKPASTRAARVVWAAVALATAAATTILVAFRVMDVAPVPEVSIPSIPLRGGALLLLVGATLALRVVRATFPEVRGDREAWWAANLGKAVAIWALADGIAILGAVAYFLSSDALVLALAVGWAAAMFVGHAPGRLTDG